MRGRVRLRFALPIVQLALAVALLLWGLARSEEEWAKIAGTMWEHSDYMYHIHNPAMELLWAINAPAYYLGLVTLFLLKEMWGTSPWPEYIGLLVAGSVFLLVWYRLGARVERELGFSGAPVRGKPTRVRKAAALTAAILLGFACLWAVLSWSSSSFPGERIGHYSILIWGMIGLFFILLRTRRWRSPSPIPGEHTGAGS